jgi:hypothetical protein
VLPERRPARLGRPGAQRAPYKALDARFEALSAILEATGRAAEAEQAVRVAKAIREDLVAGRRKAPK